MPEATDEVFNDADPLTPPETVDHARLGVLMRKIEGLTNEKGWNQPHAGTCLYLIYDNTVDGTDEHFAKVMGGNPALGKALRMGPYSAQRFFPPAWFNGTNGQTFEVLRTYALNSTYGPEQSDDGIEYGQMRRWLRVPGVIALAVVYEAWDRGHLKEPTSALMTSGYVDWGNLEGSRSIRVVAAVDCFDEVHHLKRVEGDNHTSDPEHGVPVRGDLTTTMRILMDMIYSRSPRPSEFLTHYPTLTAAIAQKVYEGSAGL